MNNSPTPKVSIIVLNWNNAKDTLECLDSLGKIDYPNFEPVVVDNGSRDGSPEIIKNRFPGIKLIRIGDNCGFCGANNVGVKAVLESAPPDYILLLNNDTIVNPGILSAFVDAARSLPDAGFLSARIYYHDEPGRIWSAVNRWNPEEGTFDQVGFNELDDEARFGRIEETDYASGCALFFPVPLVNEIGLLEPRFFCYFEEVDWSFRAARRGYRNYYVPAAKLWHKVSVNYGGKESPVVLYFRTRNILLWAARNLTFSKRRAIYSRLFREILGPFSPKALARPDCGLLKSLYWRIRATRRDPSSIARRLGVRDYLLRRFGDCPARVKETLKHNQEVYERVMGKA